MIHSVSVPPQSDRQPQGYLVTLHGWGSNAQDFAELIPHLGLVDWQCYCLEAPFPHQGIPNGKAWYDLAGPLPSDIDHSKALITAFLRELPLNRTVLMGFSQGGAMTMDVGLSLPLAGLIALSGYLHPDPQKLYAPPLLIVHGTEDQVVPIAAAHHSRDLLSAMGIPITYYEFPMGHLVNDATIEVVQSFILNLGAS